jgi:hypothetical protein
MHRQSRRLFLGVTSLLLLIQHLESHIDEHLNWRTGTSKFGGDEQPWTCRKIEKKCIQPFCPFIGGAPQLKNK